MLINCVIQRVVTVSQLLTHVHRIPRHSESFQCSYLIVQVWGSRDLQPDNSVPLERTSHNTVPVLNQQREEPRTSPWKQTNEPEQTDYLITQQRN